MPYLYFFILCFCSAQPAYCQTHVIDSLRYQISITGNNKKKLDAIFAMCSKRHSLSTDTLYRYASVAKTLSEAEKNKHDIALADYY
jgi:hypothetical protein